MVMVCTDTIIIESGLGDSFFMSLIVCCWWWLNSLNSADSKDLIRKEVKPGEFIESSLDQN